MLRSYLIVKLSGGLGNQMFQYAFGQGLARKMGIYVYYDISFFKFQSLRKIELYIFPNININIAGNSLIYGLHFFPYAKLTRMVIKINTWVGKLNVWYRERELSHKDNLSQLLAKRNYLEGYWQSDKYFIDIISDVKKFFTFPELKDFQNLEIVDKLNHPNAVSLHIRRGDYVQNIGKHAPCSVEYYRNAMQNIAEKVKTPFFFVFTDDPQWFMTDFIMDYPYELISWNTGSQSYIDMQLMSLCKHNIISNSTFSWWGAWLNTNPSKIVIAPSQWFGEPELNKQTEDLVPDQWVRL